MARLQGRIAAFIGVLIGTGVSIGVCGPAAAQRDPAAALTAQVDRLYDAGRYAEAIPLAEQALALREKAFGANNPALANSVFYVGLLYEMQGRAGDAEPIYRRALALYEKSQGPFGVGVANTLDVLGNSLRNLGRYAEAEPVLRRALQAREKKGGPDDPDLADTLSNLALLLQDEQRFEEAEALYKRSLAIRSRGRLGHKTVQDTVANFANTLNYLAHLYEIQDRFAEAEPIYKDVLALQEKLLGPSHPDVAGVLMNLSFLYDRMGQFGTAEDLARRALALYQKALDPEHPETARVLDNIGAIERETHRYDDSEAHIKQALLVRESSFGPDHRDVADSLNDLMWLYLDQERYADALPLLRRLVKSGRAIPGVALPVLFGAKSRGLISEAAALDLALDIVQRAGKTSTANAINKLAARLAVSNNHLAQLVRRDQDLAAESDSLDKALLTAVSRDATMRDRQNEERIRARLGAVVAERIAVQKAIAAEAPDYAALSQPLPLSAHEIQQLLSPEEAIVVFGAADKNDFAAERRTFVIALARDAVDWKPIPLGGERLAERIADFRRGLDVDMVEDQSYLDSIGVKRQLFDLQKANDLYVSLIGPVERLLKDKKHILIVPFGPLTALPFHLLVTEKPRAGTPSPNEKITLDDMAPYRDAEWMIKRQAVSVLPSLASLNALRAYATRERAPKPLVGFGDPVFNAKAYAAAQAQGGTHRKVSSRNIEPGRGYTDFWQGANVDIRELGRALPQLPETADELRAIAERVGADAADVHLGPDASVTTVKNAVLTDYRIVYFATHGLVDGDVKGWAEPSLALSIPQQPTQLDNGLLTASDVMQLKLNADWVVLSACNTIAGNKPGAEALSGLARAFFYAGAKALLVTDWSIASDAATRLRTATFNNLKSSPDSGRAEALRQAMLSSLHDTTDPKTAYPAIWGPFEIVGDGPSN